MPASSHGPENRGQASVDSRQPSADSRQSSVDQRRINVEANLLSERLAQQERVFRVAKRKLFGIGVVVVIGCAIIPALYSAQAGHASRLVALKSKLEVSGAELNEMRSLQEQAAPAIANEAIMHVTRWQTEVFLGNIIYVLNATPDTMAVSSLHTEAVGGSLTLRGRADAEGISVAQSFLAAAGAGPGARSMVLLSTKRSSSFSEGGVDFEFLKRVNVEGS